jgi:hypothetical protein
MFFLVSETVQNEDNTTNGRWTFVSSGLLQKPFKTLNCSVKNLPFLREGKCLLSVLPAVPDLYSLKPSKIRRNCLFHHSPHDIIWKASSAAFHVIFLVWRKMESAFGIIPYVKFAIGKGCILTLT